MGVTGIFCADLDRLGLAEPTYHVVCVQVGSECRDRESADTTVPVVINELNPGRGIMRETREEAEWEPEALVHRREHLDLAGFVSKPSRFEQVVDDLQVVSGVEKDVEVQTSTRRGLGQHLVGIVGVDAHAAKGPLHTQQTLRKRRLRRPPSRSSCLMIGEIGVVGWGGVESRVVAPLLGERSASTSRQNHQLRLKPRAPNQTGSRPGRRSARRWRTMWLVLSRFGSLVQALGP